MITQPSGLDPPSQGSVPPYLSKASRAVQFVGSSHDQPLVQIITQVNGDEADPSSSWEVKPPSGDLGDEWGAWPGTGTAAVELRQEPSLSLKAAAKEKRGQPLLRVPPGLS